MTGSEALNASEEYDYHDLGELVEAALGRTGRGRRIDNVSRRHASPGASTPRHPRSKQDPATSSCESVPSTEFGELGLKPGLSAGAKAALSAFGAWSHIDWDETLEFLERIKNEVPPTPPIEDL